MKFISYSGSMPCLCVGDLIVEHGNTLWTFSLISGGSVTFDDDWNEEVAEGCWSVDTYRIPDGFPPGLVEAVESLANENIPLGCCGGCV